MNQDGPTMFQSGWASIVPVVILAALVFGLNAGHQVQQSVADQQQQLAQRLVEGSGYTLDRNDVAVPQFYPMWGMSLVMAVPLTLRIDATSTLLLVQFLLSLIGVGMAVRVSGARIGLFATLLLIPWFALMSVRWADAWSAFFMVASVGALYRSFSHAGHRWTIVAGCAVGLAAQFRSDVLAWTWLMAAISFVPGVQRSLRRPTLTVALVALLWMTPWAVRSASSGVEHAPFLGSSNVGAVAYISLGQLPGNPWNISHVDADAMALARTKGLDDPWSPTAGAYFRTAVVESVLAHPFAAAAKVGWNIGRAVVGGLYVGEFPAVMAGPSEWADQQRLLGELQFGELVARTGFAGSMLWLVQLVIRIASVVVLAYLLWTVMDRMRPSHRSSIDLVDLALVAMVVSKLVLIGLLQYEARHMNAIYLPLLMLYARRQS